ncbi:LOW QUALITY PROTEIN: DNA topoisomerase 2-alpha-like [Ctenodactylus gundi]
MEVSPLQPVNENMQMNKIKKNEDAKKRLPIERICQKKVQLEHILLCPDTYIGSVELVTQRMWVYDEDVGINYREVTFVPGLYKIFDEILMNAADNKQKRPKMSIRVTIDPENNLISIWNNGKGMPVVEHKVEKIFVPALIFELLTSSNYDDDEKKVTGSRNGYEAKLCNICSTKFTVDTASKEYKKMFKQTWMDNMGRTGEVDLKPVSGEDYMCIAFQPDLSKFKMQSLDKDVVALMVKRADIAGSTKDVKVFLNGNKLPVKGFCSYVDMYLKDKLDETGYPLKVIHEQVNHRWEVCLTMSEKGFQQISFVNSTAMSKGGRHVDYVTDQIVTELVDGKKNKGGVAVKAHQVKNHMWIFVNALIENPTFDSQTKENMTLQAKSFGSACQLTEKFIKALIGCGIVEGILNWVIFKAQVQSNKKCSAVKHNKIKGILKLDDANDAGSRNSTKCTLILTEITLAVSGLGVVGRDKYGVFPLSGKLLSFKASHKQIMENAEINNIKIVGLHYKKNYEGEDSLKTLCNGKIMIMTDQDQEGSHIKGLLINFIHHNWPSLLRYRFLGEFITPIVKVSKNKQEMAFYSLPEFEEWKSSTPNHKKWKIKYYKVLGTSTSKEAKEYFADMKRHQFTYSGPEDGAAISLEDLSQQLGVSGDAEPSLSRLEEASQPSLNPGETKSSPKRQEQPAQTPEPQEGTGSSLAYLDEVQTSLFRTVTLHPPDLRLRMKTAELVVERISSPETPELTEEETHKEFRGPMLELPETPITSQVAQEVPVVHSEMPEKVEPSRVFGDPVASYSESRNSMEPSLAHRMFPSNPDELRELEEPSPLLQPATAPPQEPLEEVELSPKSSQFERLNEVTGTAAVEDLIQYAMLPKITAPPLELVIAMTQERNTKVTLSTNRKKSTALPLKQPQEALLPKQLQEWRPHVTPVTFPPVDLELTIPIQPTAEDRPAAMQKTQSKALELPKESVAQTLEPLGINPRSGQGEIQHPSSSVPVQPLDLKVTITPVTTTGGVHEEHKAATYSNICQLCACKNQTLSCTGLSAVQKLHAVPVMSPNNVNFTIL